MAESNESIQADAIGGLRAKSKGALMKEYHPPMTGLESHMEEEIAKQERKPEEAVQVAHELAAENRSKASTRAAMDSRTEEAMHLGL